MGASEPAKRPKATEQIIDSQKKNLLREFYSRKVFFLLIIKRTPTKRPNMTEIDQIIDGVMTPEVTGESTALVNNEIENLRERLIGVAVAGKSR